MGLITLVVLFLFTGSVVLPLKAIVLNLLSLSATFGALVWIFQDGHGAGLLDFTPTGLLDITMPVLMFALVFGLSMDYEVFLLSRIREEYLLTGDNRRSVAAGAWNAPDGSSPQPLRCSPSSSSASRPPRSRSSR